MAYKSNWFLKIIIFIVVFALGFVFFSPSEGGGPFWAFFGIASSVTGMNLANEGNEAVVNIIGFIFAAAAYYFVAEVITFILLLIFGKKNK